jgi:hypothetical protein
VFVHESVDGVSASAILMPSPLTLLRVDSAPSTAHGGCFFARQTMPGIALGFWLLIGAGIAFQFAEDSFVKLGGMFLIGGVLALCDHPIIGVVVALARLIPDLIMLPVIGVLWLRRKRSDRR